MEKHTNPSLLAVRHPRIEALLLRIHRLEQRLARIGLVTASINHRLQKDYLPANREETPTAS